MIYSFTTPQPKSIVSHLTKIWIFYIILSIALIYSYSIYLGNKMDSFKSQQKASAIDMSEQDKIINETSQILARVKFELDLSAENQRHNDDLRDSLLKLFELVPDSVTLTQITLDETKLTLKGMAPSREQYNLLLGAPLKSVFAKSRADFFDLPSGWVNFTSISTNE